MAAVGGIGSGGGSFSPFNRNTTPQKKNRSHSVCVCINYVNIIQVRLSNRTHGYLVWLAEKYGRKPLRSVWIKCHFTVKSRTKLFCANWVYCVYIQLCVRRFTNNWCNKFLALGTFARCPNVADKMDFIFDYDEVSGMFLFNLIKCLALAQKSYSHGDPFGEYIWC